VAVGKTSKRLSGIAEIPVGAAGPFDGYSILLGTTETALVGAVNAGLKAIKDHPGQFDASVRLLEDSQARGKVFELHSHVTIPSSYFEGDTKNPTTALRIANLVREKCWEGSGKAGGYFGSENTNIANSIAALHVAYGQPLNLIRQNAQGSILCDLQGKDGLAFNLTLPFLQLKTSGDLPPYAVQALKAVDCYGGGREEEFAKKVYAPAVTALELRTTWTQAAGTLARAHTGMTKR
jgi:hydroxymethylglutaryl-CoA reductase